jgi:hypothetical protein|eukprot:COSAG06_NODE_3889_length_4802_cov_1.710610_3_plen_183_part_00
MRRNGYGGGVCMCWCSLQVQGGRGQIQLSHSMDRCGNRANADASAAGSGWDARGEPVEEHASDEDGPHASDLLPQLHLLVVMECVVRVSMTLHPFFRPAPECNRVVARVADRRVLSAKRVACVTLKGSRARQQCQTVSQVETTQQIQVKYTSDAKGRRVRAQACSPPIPLSVLSARSSSATV